MCTGHGNYKKLDEYISSYDWKEIMGNQGSNESWIFFRQILNNGINLPPPTPIKEP